jgi:hypothetical protein
MTANIGERGDLYITSAFYYQPPRKVLIIGGEHGEEWPGIDTVYYFDEAPVLNTTVVLGDEPACAEGTRFTDINIAKVEQGDPNSREYGLRRRAELETLVQQHNVTLNVHGNPNKDSDMVLIHPEANITIRAIARRLGISRVAIAGGSMLSAKFPSVATVDLGINSSVTPRDIRRLAQDLSGGKRIYPDLNAITWYKFARGVLRSEVDELGLPDLNSFEPFQELSETLTSALGLTAPVYGAFWNQRIRAFEIYAPGSDPWERNT